MNQRVEGVEMRVGRGEADVNQVNLDLAELNMRSLEW